MDLVRGRVRVRVVRVRGKVGGKVGGRVRGRGRVRVRSKAWTVGSSSSTVREKSSASKRACNRRWRRLQP